LRCIRLGLRPRAGEQISRYYYGVVAANDVPARDWEAFVAYARANPGKLNYGTIGKGSAQHILALELGKLTGTEMVGVPYKGGADALNDVLAGRVGHELAQERLIRRLGKMHGDIPASAGRLERGDRGLALEETLGQEVDHALGDNLVANGKARAIGGGGEGRGHAGSVAGKAAG